MPVLYANNAASRLAASITNVATSFSVTAGHGARFPVITGSDHFYVTLMDSAGNLEIVRVTARATDTFTVQRAMEGTTARAYSANDIVELRITKFMLDDFKSDTRTGYLPLGGGIMAGAITFAAGQTWPTFNQNTTGNAATATNVAYSGLTGTVPTWNQNTTGTAANVTGTVAVGNGGTGASTAAAALTNLGAYPASNPSGYTSNTGTVTGVTGTAPIVSSGGTAPAISISAATTAAAGSMSAADKTKLDGIAAGATANTGTVTSVGGTGTVSGLTLSGSVTTSGNLTLGGTLSLTSGNVTTALGFTPYNATNPSGYIDTNGTARTIVENNGTVVGTRRALNFIPGTGISLSIADDAANEEVDITITSTVTGGVTSFNTRTGAVTLSSADVTTALGATPVYTSTDQTVAGVKTFSGSRVQVSGGGVAMWEMHIPGAHARGFYLSSDGITRLATTNGAGVASTVQLSIDASSNFTASGNVTANSDERLKRDWADLPADFLEQLADTKVGTYTRIDTRARQIGVSAQSVQRFAPEGVLNLEGFLSVAYGNVALASAVELAKRLLAAEKEIAVLKELVRGTS
jgi:hypothetical protein